MTVARAYQLIILLTLVMTVLLTLLSCSPQLYGSRYSTKYSFYVSTIVPIPKGRNNNLYDSSNFRGIAFSPVYGKIYDTIVLSQHIDTLMSSELQFGFKAHRSTNMRTMILR